MTTIICTSNNTRCAKNVYKYSPTTTLNIFYCSKRQKDKTQDQLNNLRQSSPITYITKYTTEHNNI